MNRFKVGDKVKCLSNSYSANLKRGEIYIVEAIMSEGEFLLKGAYCASCSCKGCFDLIESIPVKVMPLERLPSWW